FIASGLLSKVVAFSGVTSWLVMLFDGLEVSPYLILLGIVVLYIFLGMMLDATAMVLLTLPFTFPIVSQLGFDPVWFGILLTLLIELALITPPVGINVFMINRVMPSISVGTIFRGVFPFVLLTMTL